MTKKFRDMCKIYRIFAEQYSYCDFSENAIKELYEFETFGKGNIKISGFNASDKNCNGYAVGKKWLNVQVKAWLRDCELFIDGEENKSYRGWYNILRELYSDNRFPNWWLDEIFKKFINNKKSQYSEFGMLMDMSYK